MLAVPCSALMMMTMSTTYSCWTSWMLSGRREVDDVAAAGGNFMRLHTASLGWAPGIRRMWPRAGMNMMWLSYMAGGGVSSWVLQAMHR
jgi:hypothetical protein